MQFRLASGGLCLCLALDAVGAFQLKPSLVQPRRGFSQPRRTQHKVAMSADVFHAAGQALVAYSDEINVSTNSAIAGISFLGATAALTAAFFLLTKNLKAKSFTFDLTEEEDAAVAAVNDLFDPTPADKELTESGTQGYVKRRQLAEEAKLDYQAGRMDREVRDKSLYYAEVDLNFLAALLRAAEPQGGVFYDLGSGTGKAVFGAALLYRWKKAVGVELLPVLHKEALSYQGRFRRLGGSPTEFKNSDFMDPKFSLGDADVIFAYATRYLSTSDGQYTVDVTEKCIATAPVGARIITLDRKLKGPQFKLLKELTDLSGDLQRVRGFVFEKVA